MMNFIRRDYLLACLERNGLNKISDFWIDAAIEKYREKYPEED